MTVTISCRLSGSGIPLKAVAVPETPYNPNV